MRLHINPEVLGRMFFYDIMLLYHRYEKYVEEENESNKQQEMEYQERHSDMMSEVNDMKNNMPNYEKNFSMPNYTVPTFNMPNFNF